MPTCRLPRTTEPFPTKPLAGSHVITKLDTDSPGATDKEPRDIVYEPWITPATLVTFPVAVTVAPNKLTVPEALKVQLLESV